MSAVGGKAENLCSSGVLPVLTQCMVRPCVARGLVELAFSGLASMYPVSDWSCFAPDQYGYQRACDLISGQASTGHSGHQCSHAPGRPILHLFSFSRRPRRVRVLITSSIASWLCTVPLFVPGGRSFVPTCGCRGAPRAGTVKVGRRACLASRASVARPRLDGPEHGARIKRVGTRFHWS